MIINKIITGEVTQVFDTETGEWVDQEFIAGEESYKTEDGQPETDDGEDIEDLFPDIDLPMLLVQPFQKKQRLEWDCAGFKWIEIESDGEGNGRMDGNLKKKCPYCDIPDCYGVCGVSQWFLNPETQEVQIQIPHEESSGEELESLKEMKARQRYNSSIDAMSFFLLSLASNGHSITGFGATVCRTVEELGYDYMERTW